MSENRIRKTDTVQASGPASAGIWVGTDKTIKYNPDGTTRYVAPITVSVMLGASDVDRNVFVAPVALQLVRAQEAHSVAGGSGAQVDVKKCTGTTAPASGTTMLGSVFSLTGTADTVVDKALSATTANLQLAAGDRVAFDMSGTLTGLVGVVTLTFKQI